MKKLCLISFLCSIMFAANAQDLSNLKQGKAVSLSGGLSLGGFNYFATGIENRLPAFGYAANADATLNIYGLSIPFSLAYNEQGSSLQNPFTRFGISPKYKWLTLHAGHRNLVWSPFVLQGATFLGGGVEVNVKKLRLGAMYGLMNEDLNSGVFAFDVPRYKRHGLTFKIGLGTENNHVDFVVLKGKDDTTSVFIPENQKELAPAQENLALGLKTKFALIKNKLFFNMDVASSIFSEDLRTPSINLEGVNYSEYFTKVFDLKPSTHANYAGESSLAYQQRDFRLSLNYRRIMPEYKCFGVNYLLTDIEALTINPSFNLFKNKVNISGSYGVQNNNLDGHLERKTSRNIGSLALSVNPTPFFGFYAQYANFTLYQQVIIDSLNNDSLIINQINHNFNFAPRVTLIRGKNTHNLMLNINYQILEDKNQYTALFSENGMLVANLIYSLVIKNKDLSIQSGLNYFEFSTYSLNNAQYGLNVGLTKGFFKKKLNYSTNLSANMQSINGDNGINFAWNNSFNYSVSKWFTIGLSLNHFNNQVKNPFSETRSQLNLRMNF